MCSSILTSSALALALVICASSGLADKGVTPKSTLEGSTEGAPIEVLPQGDQTTLAEALRVLERRKREVSRSHQPYSAYRPLSGTHSRYRYPLYKKRSSYNPSPDYYDYDTDYDYDADYSPRPSLFRERVRGPSSSLISNGYFFDKRSKGHQEALPHRQEKRVSRRYPTVTQFFDTLDALKSRYNRDYYSKGHGMDYYDLTRFYSPEYASRHLAIRRKRSVPDASVPEEDVPETENDEVDTTEQLKNNDSTSSPSKDNQRSQPSMEMQKMDRTKRAFQDPSKFVDPNRLRKEAENDFLTREYFKTIARSVGNKKKRMAYARFEPPTPVDKKSNFDSFIEDPSMIHYVQNQLRDTEEEIADEAEKQLRNHSPTGIYDDTTDALLLSNSIAKLDALEKMRGALYQLERLQEKENIRKRAMSLVNEEDQEMDKEKRRKALRNADVEKRKDDIFQQLFKGNKREECPVLDRIILNCIAITQSVGDEAKAFLEPCLRHEICYMCGSGLEVSRHECDALLSSALEAGCSDSSPAPEGSPATSSLGCLGAAGETLNALEDASRYDEKGTCTYDPCVRQLLDTR